MKHLWKVLVVLMLVVFAAGCGGKSGGSGDSGSSDGKSGGEKDSELRAAISGQPETLDPMMTPGSPTKSVARHIFEQLLTLNSNYEPVPMLAESVEKSEDGKVYTFKLREGVKFHNDKEMTSEDVVASMNRWVEKSPTAAATFGDAKFEAVDDYTVELKLSEVTLDTLEVIASSKQFSGIMPKEVVEAAASEGVKEYIGTGPYVFEEWKQDQYIHLKKFADYQPIDAEADGLSGKKEALVDEIYFDIVNDPSTRLSGVQTGQYDLAYSVPNDSYEQVKNDKNLDTTNDLYGNLTLIYNKKSGVATDFKIREALNAAIDSEAVMMASMGHEDLYDLDPGYMNSNQTNWYNDSGKDVYNQADIEKAKKLLKEAGYNGEEVHLMVTRDYDYQYNAAVVIQQQLEQAGVNISLDVYDWPTLLENENDPEKWDLIMIGFSTVTTPSQILYLTNNQHGFTDDEKIAGLLDDIKTAKTVEEAKEYFTEIQDYGWNEYLPVTNVGFHYDFYTTTKKVEGMTVFDGPILWNTTVYK